MLPDEVSSNYANEFWVDDALAMPSQVKGLLPGCGCHNCQALIAELAEQQDQELPQGKLVFQPKVSAIEFEKKIKKIQPKKEIMAPELAFVMYKPDAFERGLVGELMRLVDAKGLQLVQAKTLRVQEFQLVKHYAHHVGKSFWPEMVNFYTSGPTLACIYKGVRANDSIRQLIGSKHPSDSPPGSVRGKYAISFPKNLMHGSDHAGAAVHEMAIFFSPQELDLVGDYAQNAAL